MRAMRPTFSAKPDPARYAKKRKRFPISCTVASLMFTICLLFLLVNPGSVDLLRQTRALPFSNGHRLLFNNSSPSLGSVAQVTSEALSIAREAPSRPWSISQVFPSERLLFAMDYWERMIHVHYGLRFLTLLAMEAGFTVVEPFVYQSKAPLNFSLPEHFEQRGMRPQRASLYYDTSKLFESSRFVTHNEFRHKISLSQRSDKQVSVITAAVYVVWAPDKSMERFYWCDERAEELEWRKSEYGWAVGRNIHAQRIMCVSSRLTAAPPKFRKDYFDELFEFAVKGTGHLERKCKQCISLAIVNYRKHLFGNFESDTDEKVMNKKLPTLLAGKAPRDIAHRVQEEVLGKSAFLTIQMRTGKAFSVIEALNRGRTQEQNVEAFGEWLAACQMSLVKRAKEMLTVIGKDAKVYIASDMYNDGWKGGDRCPPAVREVLDEAKRRFEREFGKVYIFEPQRFGVKQDVMGVSGAVDAAMGFDADRFLYSKPSSFGLWVHEQRWQEGRHPAMTVNCEMDAFTEHEKAVAARRQR